MSSTRRVLTALTVAGVLGAAAPAAASAVTITMSGATASYPLVSLLAQQMDKCTLVRSVSYTPAGLFNHTAAMYQMLTGYTPDKVAPSGQPAGTLFGFYLVGAGGAWHGDVAVGDKPPHSGLGPMDRLLRLDLRGP